MDDLGFLFLVPRAFRLADEDLVGHVGDLVGAVAVEDDDVVDVRAVFDKLVLFQAGAHEAVGAVDV